MPQSLSAVYIHLVFSTKDHRPLLRDKPTRDALHSYLGARLWRLPPQSANTLHKNIRAEEFILCWKARTACAWGRRR